MMYWPGGGGWGLMNVGMVLIWALVVIGVVIVIRYLVRAGRRPVSPPIGLRPTEQILAARFARSEIDGDEYRWRPDVLRGTVRPGWAPRADPPRTELIVHRPAAQAVCVRRVMARVYGG